jgi:hypothetical protein
VLGRIVVLRSSSGCLNKGSVAFIWLQPEKSGWQGDARENSCSLLYRLVPI